MNFKNLIALTVLASPVFAQEVMRPAFHFTAEKNWLNDPNGLIWHDGEYHLFYQYNPLGEVWGHMSWGHAVSRDLMTWEHLPVAIPEKDGVMAFSGSAVVDHANTSGLGRDGQAPMVAIYTGHRVGNQSQRLAYSHDKGRTWTDYERNPVLDINNANFRDPKVFWHAGDNRWIMSITLSLDRKVAFYASPDLKNWELLSEFGPVGAVKGIWECPDLFELPVEGTNEKRWVLNINLGDHAVAGGSGAQYFTGEFDGKKFTADPLPPVPPDDQSYLKGDLIADFERTGFRGWKISGEAFGGEPSSGAVTGQHPVTGFLGDSFVNGYVKGDEPTGRMTSPAFKITKPYLNFLIGGGRNAERLSVSLLVDGEVRRSATGRDSEHLHWLAWPVADLMGREVKVQLVDEESGGWGHLLFDHLIQSDHPAREAAENANWVDYGPDFYAAVSWYEAPAGEAGPPWIAWMSNWKYANQTPTSPWRGAMSLPRHLSLRKSNGKFTMLHRPVQQVEGWRGRALRVVGKSISEANEALRDVKGKRFDMLLKIDPGDSEEAGIKIRVGEGEATSVAWSRLNSEVFVDRTKSGQTDFHPDFAARHGAPLPLKDGLLEIRVITDDCSVEVFADDGAISLTSLIFPSATSDKLEFYQTGGSAKVVSAEIYPLAK